MRTLPLFPLGSVLFPRGPLSLRIFETRYVDMVSRCLKENIGFVVILLVDGPAVDRASSYAAAIGTEARIVDFNRLDDGLLGISCLGVSRVRVLRSWREPDGLNMGEIIDVPDAEAGAIPEQYGYLVDILKRVYPELGETYAGVEARWHEAGWVADRLAEIAPLDARVRQRLLEQLDPIERLQFLGPLIRMAKTDA